MPGLGEVDFEDIMSAMSKPKDMTMDNEHSASTSRGWMDTAAQHLRNEEYYRGLVHQIGEMLGDAAFTDDGGDLHDTVLCAKVPDLVREALAKRTRPIGGKPEILGFDLSSNDDMVGVAVMVPAGRRAVVSVRGPGREDLKQTVTGGQTQRFTLRGCDQAAINVGEAHSTVEQVFSPD